MPDGLLNNLVTTIPGFFFDEAIFNLDATANGSANITALDQFGTAFSFMLPLAASRQNVFTLSTEDGQLISRVSFTTNVGLDARSMLALWRFTRWAQRRDVLVSGRHGPRSLT